jgi:hypothetical protein
MHLQMMQLFADGHAATQESATAVEETCIPELVYTRRCGYNRILALGSSAGGLGGGGGVCLAAYYKDALQEVIVEHDRVHGVASRM